MGTLILRDSHRSLEKKMEDLDRLKDETAKRIKEAADQGDLKENDEYHAAREEQSLIIRKMQTLQSYSPFQISNASYLKLKKKIQFLNQLLKK